MSSWSEAVLRAAKTFRAVDEVRDLAYAEWELNPTDETRKTYETAELGRTEARKVLEEAATTE